MMADIGSHHRSDHQIVRLSVLNGAPGDAVRLARVQEDRDGRIQIGTQSLCSHLASQAVRISSSSSFRPRGISRDSLLGFSAGQTDNHIGMA